MEEVLINDDAGNRCFGCSPHNDRGLKMTFVKRAAGEVESRIDVAPHFCGADGVIHGGVQATLLDEAMGMAVRTAMGDDPRWVVTAEFKLRYRLPAPTGQAVRVRGSVVRREGADFFVEGVILDTGGQRLTIADARWRIIEPSVGADG